MFRAAIAVAVALAAMATMPLPAIADEAEVERNSDVYRTRTGDEVLYRLRAGTVVEVLRCRGRRCEIDAPRQRRNGWILKQRLAPIDEGGEAHEDIPFEFGIIIGPGGPGFDFRLGGDGDSGVSIDFGTGETSGPRVCLFDGVNYTGVSRCFGRGERVDLTSVGWNDAAESLQVIGGARAQLCEHVGGGGACFNADLNYPDLGGWRNFISYIDVY